MPPLELRVTPSATLMPPSALSVLLAALRVRLRAPLLEVMFWLTRMLRSARRVREALPPAVLAIALLTVMSPEPAGAV